MAYNQPNNFWNFARAFDGNVNGEGVDRPAQTYGEWPFGGSAPENAHAPPPHGPHDGRHRGPHHEPHRGPGSHGPPPHHGSGHHAPPPPPFGGFPFGGHGGFFGPHPHHRGGRRGHCGRRGERHGERGSEDEEYPRGTGEAFDLNSLFASLATHPLAQQYRQFFEQATGQYQHSGETTREAEAENAENSFTPPVDVFTTESHFVLHVALPGAKKEDVGINWDAEKGVLNLAGVIYRPGDEEFLKGLTQSERKVGVFERAVKLPPAGGSEEKDEVDGDGITAKLEDGVLVVRVPKLEKEWTDVKKVDIE